MRLGCRIAVGFVFLLPASFTWSVRLMPDRICTAEETRNETTSAKEDKPLARNTEAAQAAKRQPTGVYEHPDGSQNWKEWGITPRTMTREERLQQRSTIDSLLGARAKSRKDVLSQLTGASTIDTARVFLEILGVETLPNEPEGSWPSMQLTGDALRSIEGFSPLGVKEKLLWSPDRQCRVVFESTKTREHIYVRLVCADSAAQALAAWIKTHALASNATVGTALPTCRINNGPGEFCWLSWTRTNEEGTLYYPSDADILFIRSGVAVQLNAMQVAKHESVMELARKIDALLLRQRTEGKKAKGDGS